MSRVPPSVRVSIRIYRLLLRLYPRSFRCEFGSEMRRLFEEIAGDAVERRGWIGLALMWFRILLDTASAVPRERVAEAQQTLCVIRQSFLDLRWQTALLISLFLGMVLTPADLASMVLFGIPLFGVYVCAANSLPFPGSLRTVFVSVSTLPLIIAIGLMTKPLRVVPIAENLFGLSPVALCMVLLMATVLTMAATLIAVRIWVRKSRENLFHQ